MGAWVDFLFVWGWVWGSDAAGFYAAMNLTRASEAVIHAYWSVPVSIGFCR